MASSRPESEAETSKQSRISRSLSATRRFFRNSENLADPNNEDAIRPVSPEVNINNHSSRQSSENPESDSDNESISNKSVESERRKSRRSRQNDRSYQSDRASYNDKVERDRQRKL